MADEKPKKNSNVSNAYRKTDVMTANRETILLMLYSGAIRFLKQAITESEKGNHSDKSRYIANAQQIINELRATLNHQTGGDVANNLELLYDFITRRLLQGNLDRNNEYLKEALNLLCTLNTAWEQAIESVRNETRIQK